MSARAYLDRRFYPDHTDNWDDWRFRDLILKVLSPTDILLDLGAGAGVLKAMDFRGKAARICGVDPDARVLLNPHLDEGKIGTAEAIPYDDETFDIVICDNVVEHLPDPVSAFREVRRVLRPGGIFLFKTPNRRHYVPLIARLTPIRFHRWVNKRRGRAAEDTFPTLYRANTPSAATGAIALGGLSIRSLELIEGRPEYLRFNAAAYMMGIAYERVVNSLALLSSLRVVMIGEAVNER